jgi:uncharacterized RDD family membrane protein YckC
MHLEKIISKYSSEFIFIRIISYLIDIFILLFFSSIIFLIIFMIVNKLQIFVYLSIFIITFLLYFILTEGISGYTIGKLIFRIKVVDYKGKNPGILKAFIRTLLRFFELNPICFLSLVAPIIAFSTNKKQRLGDLAASTYVLRYKDLIEIDNFKSYYNNDMDLTELDIQNMIKNNKINKKFTFIFLPISFIFIIITLLLPNLYYLNLSEKNKKFNISKTYTSYDKSLKLSLTSGWKKYNKNDSDTLLHIVNEANNLDIIISKYKKSDYKNSLINFYENEIESNYSKYDNIEKTELLNIVINQNEGIEFICYYKKNNKMYGNLFTAVEGNESFFLISSKGLKSDFESNKMILKNITKTLYLENENSDKKFHPEFEETLNNSRAIIEN